MNNIMVKIFTLSFLCLFQFNAMSQGVGIGTTDPSGELHINDQNGDKSVLTRLTTTSGNVILGFNVSSQCFFGTSSNHDVRIRTNGTNRLVIDNIGNIGIGLNEPSEKLHINGGNLLISNLGATNSMGVMWGESAAPVYGWIYDGIGGGSNNQMHLREFIGTPSDVLTVKGDGRIFLPALSSTSGRRPVYVSDEGELISAETDHYLGGQGPTFLAADYIFENIHFPQGATLESVTINYLDSDDAENIVFRFTKRNHTDVVAVASLFHSSGDAFSSTIVRTVVLPIPASFGEIDNENFVYALSVDQSNDFFADDQDLRFRSYVFKYSY